MFIENRHIPALRAARDERYAKHRAAAGEELVTFGYVEESTPFINGGGYYDLTTAYVQSATRPMTHRVRVRASIMGVDCECDCEGHEYGRVCWHIAAVLDALEVTWAFDETLAPAQVEA